MTGQREDELLLYLSRQREYTTANTLANVLQTSVKTVYRLIKKVNESEILITAAKGKGYKLNYDSYMVKTCNHSMHNISPYQRQNNIMVELLYQSPSFMLITDLYKSYYVSNAVIFKDEKMISTILMKYNLLYERKNRRSRIVGSEENIRKAISDMIAANQPLDIEDLKKFVSITLDTRDVVFVLEQLHLIEMEMGTEFSYPYDINLFFHIYIMIRRIRNDGIVVSNITKEAEMAQNKALCKAASHVIHRIHNYIHRPLPQAEVNYLWQYLVAFRMKENGEGVSELPLVKEVTEEYINYFRDILGKHQDDIYQDLLLHIRPMIQRLQQNIKIKNRLLESIKVEYGMIFKRVQETSQLVSQKFDLPMVNDDENGFITLYIARVLEQNPRPINIVIVCTTGVGTSELLKVKVAKRFPQVHMIAIISTRDIGQTLKQYPEIDMLLTTVHITQNIEIPVILVSAVFNITDQERVQRAVEEISYIGCS